MRATPSPAVLHHPHQEMVWQYVGCSNHPEPFLADLGPAKCSWIHETRVRMNTELLLIPSSCTLDLDSQWTLGVIVKPQQTCLHRLTPSPAGLHRAGTASPTRLSAARRVRHPRPCVVRPTITSRTAMDVTGRCRRSCRGNTQVQVAGASVTRHQKVWAVHVSLPCNQVAYRPSSDRLITNQAHSRHSPQRDHDSGVRSPAVPEESRCRVPFSSSPPQRRANVLTFRQSYSARRNPKKGAKGDRHRQLTHGLTTWHVPDTRSPGSHA